MKHFIFFEGNDKEVSTLNTIYNLYDSIYFVGRMLHNLNALLQLVTQSNFTDISRQKSVEITLVKTRFTQANMLSNY